MALPEGLVHNDRLSERAKQLDVDVLALQEVDFFQARSQGVDQCELIGKALGAKYSSRGITLHGTPGEKWRTFDPTKKVDAHTTFASLPGLYGNGIVSRIPIIKEFRLNLGRSKLGAPLAIPQSPTNGGRPKMRLIYIHDEPRVAHAIYLENGYTIINTHLSFVPGMNVYQLRKIRSWARTIPGIKILLGDFNLPGKIPEKITKWKGAVKAFTYPSWGANLQFDHILIEQSHLTKFTALTFTPPEQMVSDHLPVGIEILEL